MTMSLTVFQNVVANYTKYPAFCKFSIATFFEDVSNLWRR